MTRRLNASCRLTIASAMTLSTLLYGGCVTSSYAASNLFEPGSYEQLARAEQVFFGKPNTTNSYFRRLDLLDVGIFGRVRSGSAEKRFDRISDALGLDTMSNAAPARPQADLTKNNAGSADKYDSQVGSSLSAERHGDSNSDFSNSVLASSSTSSTTYSSTASAAAAPFSSSDVSSSGENISSELKSNLAENNHAQRVKSNAFSNSKTVLGSGLSTASSSGSNSAFNSAYKSAFNPANKGTATASKTKTTAVAAKPGFSAILSKETPKLEPQVAVAKQAADTSDRRIKRPAVGAQTGIAHDKTKEVEDLFKKGQGEFREKRYAEAQTCFKKILAIDPRNVDAYYNLGSLSETRHDYIDALTYYRAALATKPLDTDFKSAVHAMEEELNKQHAVTASKSDHHSSTSPIADVGSSNVPEVTVGGQQAPIVDVSSTDAPVVPVQQIGDKTFSLQTAQNGLNTPYTPMNGIQTPYQGVPIYGVPPTLAGNIPSNNNIAQTPPNSNSRGTFNTILKFGANAALQGSGLHCPICRVLGGMH